MTVRRGPLDDTRSEAAEETADSVSKATTGVAGSAESEIPPLGSESLSQRHHWRWLTLVLFPVLAILAVPAIYLVFNGYLQQSGIAVAPSESTAKETGSSDPIAIRTLVPPLVSIEIQPYSFPGPFNLDSVRAEALVRFARTDLATRPYDPLADDLVATGGAQPIRAKTGIGQAAWPADVRQDEEGATLRLGDVVLSGQVRGTDIYNAIVYMPDRGFADLGAWPEDLLDWESIGRQRRLDLQGVAQQQQEQQRQQQQQQAQERPQQQQQQQSTVGDPPLFATHPDIVMAAVQVALLRADRAGRRSVAIVRSLNDVFPVQEPAPFLTMPADLWIYTVLRAFQSVGPALSSIETVLLVPHYPDLIYPDPDLIYPDPEGNFGWTKSGYTDLLLGLTPGDFMEAYVRAAQHTLAIDLPWPRRDEFLSATWAEAAEAESALSAEQLNPILSTAPRWSYLPLAVGLGIFVFSIAFQLRRHAPVHFNVAAITAGGGVISAGFAYALFLILQSTGSWLLALPSRWSPVVESGVYLGLACVLTAALGGVASFVAFRLARAEDPRLASDEGTRWKASHVRAYLYSDKPVVDLSEDRLNFAPLVTALASFLDNRGTKPPVVVAVNGPWGSGKSSLMSMLANELEKTGRFHIAWFNAWQYQKQDQILAAFLKSVAGELSKVWGPWLSLRLARVRFKHASFSELFLLLLPVFLVALALAVPTIAEQLTGRTGDKEPDAGLIGGLEALFYVLGGGGFLVQARKVLPFRFSAKWLFSGSDLSRKLGFLDEFQREFRLYREAVGRDKFLIIVDDLDRCNPDAVVEVLKTVNLIVNGDNGPGKTFFVLGFDERYIVQSIEEEFKDFAQLDDRGAGSFGRDYLKKIVTVSLAVPVPHQDLLKRLAKMLGEGVQPDKRVTDPTPKGIKASGAWLTAKLDLFRRPLPLVLLIFTVLGLIVWFGQADRMSGRKDTVPPPAPAAQENLEPEELGDSEAAGARNEVTAAVEVALPAAGQSPEAAPADWLRWLDHLGVLLAVAAALGFAAAVRRQRLATPEPLDTREFTEALIAIEDYLPKNPRDLVRLVNRMRVDFLVQAPRHGPSARSDGPVSGDMPRRDKGLVGEELTAEESVAMTYLRMTHRDLFDPAKLDAWLRPDLESKGPSKAFHDLLEDEGERGEWMRELKAILDDVAPAKAVLKNKDKLARHISVQGYFAAPVEADSDENPPDPNAQETKR